MKKNTLVLIDGMNTVFKAYYAYQNLTNKGKPVSIIYGLPMILWPIIRQYGKKKCVVVWEGGRAKFRLKLLPEYKAKRKQFSPEEKLEFQRQLTEVRMMLKALGVKQIRVEGFEADDIIASYALTRQAKGKKALIVSEDKDFYHLISNRISVLQTTKRRLLHHKNFEKEMGMTPTQHAGYLVLRGDSSDNIPGVPGVGEKTALQIIKEHKSIGEFMMYKGKTPRITIGPEEIKKIILRNMDLIYLGGTKKDLFKHPNKQVLSKYQDINPINLKKICQRNNITSFLKPNFTKAFT